MASKSASKSGVIPIEVVEQRIFVLHGHRVMLDRDLAELYGVETRVLNQAVKRNSERFPGDFMFQLSMEEAQAILPSRSQTVILNRGRNIKYRPHVFTEQGGEARWRSGGHPQSIAAVVGAAARGEAPDRIRWAGQILTVMDTVL